MAEEDWGKIFNRFDPSEIPTFEAWYEEFQHLVEHHSLELPELTGWDFLKRLRKIKLTGAAGVDSWRVREALDLPLALLDQVAAVFNEIERGGVWPPALVVGLVPLLPKSGDSADTGGPTKQRPVTILSVFYRIYASVRYKHLLPWQAQWINKGLRGGVPKDLPETKGRVYAKYDLNI